MMPDYVIFIESLVIRFIVLKLSIELWSHATIFFIFSFSTEGIISKMLLLDFFNDLNHSVNFSSDIPVELLRSLGKAINFFLNLQGQLWFLEWFLDYVLFFYHRAWTLALQLRQTLRMMTVQHCGRGSLFLCHFTYYFIIKHFRYQDQISFRYLCLRSIIMNLCWVVSDLFGYVIINGLVDWYFREA